MIMEKYEKPEMEVMDLEDSFILTDSGCGSESSGSENNEGGLMGDF